MFATKPSGLEALIHRPRPSTWRLFLKNPCMFLAQALYRWHMQGATSRTQQHSKAVSVVCVSDTHNAQCPIPEADILIHAGDLTQSGTLEELQATISWLRKQPHPTKIVIAGNHDLLLDDKRASASTTSTTSTTSLGRPRDQLEWGDILYLQDSSTTVTAPNGRRLRVYGSPMSPRHGNWAFQYPRHEDVWTNRVPDDTDILVTHGPPHAHLDLGKYGCSFLLRELWRVHPALHVFGHIHEGHGHELAYFDGAQNAYEKTVRAGGGFWNLVTFVYALFTSDRSKSHTQLVNASIVGGLRDDKRRLPIIVYV